MGYLMVWIILVRVELLSLIPLPCQDGLKYNSSFENQFQNVRLGRILPYAWNNLCRRTREGFWNDQFQLVGSPGRASKNGPAIAPAREEATRKLLLQGALADCVPFFTRRLKHL